MKTVGHRVLVVVILTLSSCLFFDSENNGVPAANNIVNNTCGNNIIDGTEACDGTNFGDATCDSVVPNTLGNLTCDNCVLNTDNCKEVPDSCNDGVLDEEEGELCDDTDFGGLDCQTIVGPESVGDLACDNFCDIDTTDCSASCGNGIVEAGEECENGVIENDACEQIVGPGSTGTASCNDCRYEPQGCTQVYKQISAGGQHTCALKFDNTLRCWGAGNADSDPGEPNNFGQAIPPTTKFETISSGAGHNCGIDALGEVSCWGRNDNLQTSNIKDGFYSAISAGVSHTCGVLEGGQVRCWGLGTFRQIEASVSASAVGAGRDMTCVLSDEDVTCFGAVTGPITNKFSSINPGGGTVMCGVPTIPGKAPCWGIAGSTWQNGNSPNPTPPFDTFGAVDAGRFHACGLLEDGQVKCWGRDIALVGVPPATDKFSQISVGDFHTCALTMKGEAVCWGKVELDLDFGQAIIPTTTERLVE